MSQPILFCCRDRAEFGWLSNFEPAEIIVRNVVWRTVEHFYQASKFPDDLAAQHAIWDAPLARDAKKLGKQFEIRADWDEVKEQVMLNGLWAKFSQNPKLAEKLLATDDRELIEDAPWDPVWGTGRDGKGLNKLGVLLMEIRRVLRESATNEHH